MAVLLVENGKEKGRALKIAPGKTVTVGRERACDLPIQDVMVSRRHFHVRADDAGRFFVRDLKSSNGTFLNGRRLAAEADAAIELEDKVQVGSHLLALVGDATGESSGARGELTGKT